jgi:hypothetical protein
MFVCSTKWLELYRAPATKPPDSKIHLANSVNTPPDVLLYLTSLSSDHAAKILTAACSSVFGEFNAGQMQTHREQPLHKSGFTDG